MTRLIKVLGGLTMLAIGGFCVWWFVMAGVQERAATRWLADQRARGWQAEANGIEVTGFPTEFDMALRDIALADPRAGWSWSAPSLDALASAFRPNRMLVTFPGRQIVAVPGERAEIEAALMTADLHVAARSSMALRETGLNIEALAISGQSGWTAGARHLSARISDRPDDLSPPNTYEVRAIAGNVVLPREIVAELDPTGFLDPKIGEVELTGYVTLADPLDRLTVEQGRLALRNLVIRRAGFTWGEMRLDAQGEVRVDRQGYPEGQIEVSAREWRRMVALAEKSGFIGRDLAETITGGLEFLSALTGGSDLKVPLGLRGGQITLGPIPIGRAPRIAEPW